MKKKEIENKDKELIKKFRTIIHNKEKNREGKPTPKRFPFGLIFLLTILIISSLLFLTAQPPILFSKEPKTSSWGELVPVPEKQPASSTRTEEIAASSDMPKVPPPIQKVEDKETVPKSSDSVLSNPILEQSSPEEFSNQKVQGDMPSGIIVAEIISCSSVKNRQYSRPKIEFSLAQDTTPKIWMKVISENPPFTLTHVYYCNGRKYCEVPLAIRYHRMRTWSHVTLRRPEHIGKWRVEVMDDSGAKLDQIEFIVVK
jgi:hypothetical protein